MRLRRIALVMAVSLLGAAMSACAARSTAAPTGGAAGQPPSPDPWPRSLQLASAAVLVYQPQVESWRGNQLQFRCAVAATPNGAQDKIFGVIWGTAQTQVDRVNRRVTLDNLTLTGSNFPTLPDNGAAYLSELQQQLPGTTRTISLDRLQASLSRSTTVDNAKTGQTNTYSSGYNGDDRYADMNGNTYSNDGSGWQKTSSTGTQSAAPDTTSWADREAQARGAAENRFRSFQAGGGAFRGWGMGDGTFANRFSAGGFGDRFGEADGRFAGGGGFQFRR